MNKHIVNKQQHGDDTPDENREVEISPFLRMISIIPFVVPCARRSPV